MEIRVRDSGTAKIRFDVVTSLRLVLHTTTTTDSFALTRRARLEEQDWLPLLSDYRIVTLVRPLYRTALPCY